MTGFGELTFISPFFKRPDVSHGIGTEWVRKNRQHLKNLTENANELRGSFFAELETLGRCFPSAPKDSLAHLYICRAAAELAVSWNIPFLIEMLWWDDVLNVGDSSCLDVLLVAIGQKGHGEDVEALEMFHRELGKPERFYYEEGNGNLVPYPGMVRFREKVKLVIRSCRLRGPRPTEFKPKLNGVPWSAAGY